MTIILKDKLPKNSLLQIYVEQNAYTDCYSTKIKGHFSFEKHIEAFYTTKLFKLERFILKWIVSKPSSDQEAKQLAIGSIDYFAAWTVEKRANNQILMCDFHNRTRSWLMFESIEGEDNAYRKLYFGSAVVRKPNMKNGLGFSFGLLLGFHKLYSRALLKAACRRLLAI